MSHTEGYSGQHDPVNAPVNQRWHDPENMGDEIKRLKTLVESLRQDKQELLDTIHTLSDQLSKEQP